MIALRQQPDVQPTLRQVGEMLGGARLLSDGSLMVRCPTQTHEDRTPSLHVSAIPGGLLAHCFACRDQASMLAALRGRGIWLAPRRDASSRARTSLVVQPRKLTLVTDDWTALGRAPDGAPPLPPPGRNTTRSLYRDAGNCLLGAVDRIDRKDGKTFRPWTLWQHLKTGRVVWRQKGFASPKPMYGLPELAADVRSIVVVVEGEKTCEAARRNCGRYIWVTWPNGASSVGRVDWAPLTGRHVIICPDADPPGIAAAQAIGRQIVHRAASVRIRRPPSGVPAGWDVADAVTEGWTPTEIQQFVEGRRQDEIGNLFQ